MKIKRKVLHDDDHWIEVSGVAADNEIDINLEVVEMVCPECGLNKMRKKIKNTTTK